MGVFERAITILIADDSRETRESLRKLVAFEEGLVVVGEAADGAAAVALVREAKPDIVLMDVNMPGELDGIAATQVISLEVPESVIIMMSVQGEQEYIRKAMTAGAREYLTKPFTGDELVNTIRRVHELESSRRSRFRQAAQRQAERQGQRQGERQVETRPGVAVSVAADPAAAAAFTSAAAGGAAGVGVVPPAAAPGSSRHGVGHVVTVFGSKGGAGKTVVAVNLATVLAREKKARVALVDLDLEFGDVALMLDVAPRRTIGELAREEEPLDGDLVESYLLAHSSGVRVLPAPLSPEQAETIGGGAVNAILAALRHRYDYVIIDAPPSFTEPVLVALDASETILAVTTMELPALKNMSICLNILSTLGFAEDKVKLVLNRFGREFGLTLPRVEDKLGVSVWATIPSDGATVVPSVNRGVPFVLSDPKRPVSMAVRHMADTLVGSGTAVAGASRNETRGETRKVGGLGRVFARLVK